MSAPKAPRKTPRRHSVKDYEKATGTKVNKYARGQGNGKSNYNHTTVPVREDVDAVLKSLELGDVDEWTLKLFKSNYRKDYGYENPGNIEMHASLGNVNYTVDVYYEMFGAHGLDQAQLVHISPKPTAAIYEAIFEKVNKKIKQMVESDEMGNFRNTQAEYAEIDGKPRWTTKTVTPMQKPNGWHKGLRRFVDYY